MPSKYCNIILSGYWFSYLLMLPGPHSIILFALRPLNLLSLSWSIFQIKISKIGKADKEKKVQTSQFAAYHLEHIAFYKHQQFEVPTNVLLLRLTCCSFLISVNLVVLELETLDRPDPLSFYPKTTLQLWAWEVLMTSA